MMTLTKKSINVIHLLLIGPFLAFVGLHGRKCGGMCFHVLTALGLLIVLYHGYSLYIEMGREFSPSKFGSAVKNTVGDIKQQLLGKDDNGNDVVVDEQGNVAVLDSTGQVLALNDNRANESAKQAMANNSVSM